MEIESSEEAECLTFRYPVEGDTIDALANLAQ